jgi:hypothetical protein
LDLVVYDEDSPWYGVTELKTVGDKKPRVSQMHRRQVFRQHTLAVAAQRRVVDMPWRIAVISKPTGLIETEIAAFDSHEVDATTDELVRVKHLWREVEAKGFLLDGDLVELCRCAQCYPADREKLTATIQPYAETFDLLKADERELSTELSDVKYQIVESLPGPGRYETDEWNITLRSNGALLVTKRRASKRSLTKNGGG